eukprot:Gb_29901 [translate_table: standard]
MTDVHIPLQVASQLDSVRLEGLKLGLAGDHQYINAGLAVALCHSWLRSTGHSEDFDLSETVSSSILNGTTNQEGYLPEPFVKGLAMATIPGRAQVVPDSYVRYSEQSNVEETGSADYGELIFYLDGAHSPESMEVCAKWFSYAIKEDSQSHVQAKGMVNESQYGSIRLSPNSDCQHNSTGNSRKSSKQASSSVHWFPNILILLFNCMSERDPQLLLPRLVNTCALHGNSTTSEKGDTMEILWEMASDSPGNGLFYILSLEMGAGDELSPSPCLPQTLRLPTCVPEEQLDLTEEVQPCRRRLHGSIQSGLLGGVSANLSQNED